MAARLMTVALALAASTAMAAADAPEPSIAVGEKDGIYAVDARFSVEAGAEAVRAVITDYANIPRFMPDVRTSRVLDREERLVRVEQFATARYMMFSRDIHLVLIVEEGPEVIRFGDTAGTSFRRYEGAWTITAEDGRTAVRYELTARPAFGVPGFLLRRLLDRDARLMIERLRTEIAARARPE